VIDGVGRVNERADIRQLGVLFESWRRDNGNQGDDPKAHWELQELRALHPIRDDRGDRAETSVAVAETLGDA
jgi:hypothetical protein